ncbi:MAG: lytic transglycosylase domain-containing protein, partial [Nannocystaceae bacterium]
MKARIRAVDKIVDRAAKEYRLDADLLRGMIWVESRFDPKATSPAGAKGLMQLMPATAKSLASQLKRPSRPYNTDFNVTAGAYYLRKMLNRYDGNLRYAIAAYNAGPGNVSKWTRRGGRLPAQSRSYVDKVLTARGYFTEKKLRARRMAAADAPTRAPHHEPAPTVEQPE